MDKSPSVKECVRMFYPVVVLVAAIDVLLWAHWNSLTLTALSWDNDKYSHGYLVPMFAAVLMWLRRDESAEIIKPVAIASWPAASSNSDFSMATPSPSPAKPLRRKLPPHTRLQNKK